MPALATTESSPPNLPHAAATALSRSSRERVLPSMNSAPVSWASFVPSYPLMSINATFHPSRVNLRTHAAPMPVEPPVMNTVFLISLMMILLYFCTGPISPSRQRASMTRLQAASASLKKAVRTHPQHVPCRERADAGPETLTAATHIHALTAYIHHKKSPFSLYHMTRTNINHTCRTCFPFRGTSSSSISSFSRDQINIHRIITA